MSGDQGSSSAGSSNLADTRLNDGHRATQQAAFDHPKVIAASLLRIFQQIFEPTRFDAQRKYEPYLTGFWRSSFDSLGCATLRRCAIEMIREGLFGSSLHDIAK
jgi:hypothetical protein